MATRRTAAAMNATVKQKPASSQSSQSRQKTDNTRKHNRLPVNLLIDYQVLDQFLYDYATNISLGGVFIRSKSPLPVGTKLRVAFSLPGLSEMVVTWGEVAHVVEERANEGFCGMGIRFDDLDAKSKKVIDSLIAASADEGAGDAQKKSD